MVALVALVILLGLAAVAVVLIVGMVIVADGMQKASTDTTTAVAVSVGELVDKVGGRLEAIVEKVLTPPAAAEVTAAPNPFGGQEEDVVPIVPPWERDDDAKPLYGNPE